MLKTPKQSSSQSESSRVVRWYLTSVYRDNLRAYLGGFRRALNEGGTDASKTWSILQILILIAQNTQVPLLTSIVSETLPHLKKGAIRDFFNILGETQDNNFRYNKTEHSYTFGKGVMEFFGADEAETPIPDKSLYLAFQVFTSL